MEVERRENDRLFFEELRAVQNRITDKFDAHSIDEMKHHKSTEERLASVEANLGVMTDYVKKVTEILERITVIEERDKNRITTLSQINETISDLKKEGKDSKEYITRVDSKLTKMTYMFSGGFAVLAVLWNVFSSSIDSKFSDIALVMEKTKIHLEVDKPVGWPASTNFNQGK